MRDDELAAATELNPKARVVVPLAAERRVPDPHDPGGADVPADVETLTREMVMILSAFQRFSGAQIAEALGVAPEQVAALQADAENQETITALAQVLPRPGDVQELLMSDAERNVRWLRNLREGKVDGVRLDSTDGTTLRVRARAAEVLLSRQVPKVVEQVAAPMRAIELTDAQFARIQRLLQGRPAPVLPPMGEGGAPRTTLTDADLDTRG